MPGQDLPVRWMRVGAACGFAAGLAYALAAFAPLPATPGYAAAFAFGPLLSLGIVGLYHGLSSEGPSPLTQGAALQATFVLAVRAIAGAADPARAEVLRSVRGGVNAVQLGLDVAWDVMLGSSVVLFGIAMLGHPAYGRVVGGIGIV